MTDPRDSQITSIVRVAEHDEQECARQLSETRERLNQQQMRVEQLRAYQAEYAEQGRALHGRAVNASELSARAAFMTRLDEAIAHERQQQDVMETDVAICMQQWQEKHAKAEAMRTLASKRADAAMRREARREQSMVDERSASRSDNQC